MRRDRLDRGGLLGGKASTNTSCAPGEVLVAPAMATGATISGILDPETMRLCVSTPIALALGTAQTELASIAKGSTAQYVLLVTDGGETCQDDVVGVTQQLAAAGIKTFVVGFGSADAGAAGVNTKLLDNVACAGETATNFPAPCTKGDAGGYSATSTSGPPLFYLAEDGPRAAGRAAEDHGQHLLRLRPVAARQRSRRSLHCVAGGTTTLLIGLTLAPAG